MFQIGDIVKPKKCYKGHNYCFKVIEIEKEPFVKDLYRIQRIEQQLDENYGSASYQLNIIRTVEECLWEEDEIEFASVAKLHYDITDINIPDYTSIVLDEMERNLSKLKNKVKEENEMQILDIYKERKIEALKEELSKAKEDVKKEDEIQSIILEMTNQVNTILENQGSDARYESHPNLYTSKTEKELEELDSKYYKEVEIVSSTIEEVEAMFEMTEDYQERMKILKRYGIINKDGKLSI